MAETNNEKKVRYWLWNGDGMEKEELEMTGYVSGEACYFSRKTTTNEKHPDGSDGPGRTASGASE